jgi:hypothetical protein
MLGYRTNDEKSHFFKTSILVLQQIHHPEESMLLSLYLHMVLEATG